MAIPNFPSASLSRGVTFENFTDKISDDPTLRNGMENGLLKTRPRYTATKQEFHFAYRFLTAADKAILKTFEKDTVIVGALTFTWTNPDDAVVYTVRMMNVITYQLEEMNHLKQSAKLDFVEA